MPITDVFVSILLIPYIFLMFLVNWTAFMDEFLLDKPYAYVKCERTEDRNIHVNGNGGERGTDGGSGKGTADRRGKGMEGISGEEQADLRGKFTAGRCGKGTADRRRKGTEELRGKGTAALSGKDTKDRDGKMDTEKRGGGGE